MKLAIIGAGVMGRGIAQVFASNTWRVVLVDKNRASLRESEQYLDKILSRLVDKEKISATEKNRILESIEYSHNYESIKDVDLVIEAVVENLLVKQTIFKELEAVVNSNVILATNTSSLSVTAIASSCKFPKRVVGVHFFNPPALMPLVEIVEALQTESHYMLKVINIVKQIGKSGVVTKDTPGFIVNRIARPFYSESLKMYEEGLASIEQIDYALVKYGGFRMGPFTLMDYIGNDVNYVVTKTVFDSFYGDPRYRPSITQLRHKEAGWYGRKSGRGFYNYKANKVFDEQTVGIEQNLANQIVDRVLMLLFNEAIDALFLNIASAEDIDLAMTKGVNYPKGLLSWAKEYGYKNILCKLEYFHELYGDDRYRPSVLLRTYANS